MPLEPIGCRPGRCCHRRLPAGGRISPAYPCGACAPTLLIVGGADHGEEIQPKGLEAAVIVPVIIESLLQNHRKLEALLQILEQELAMFDRRDYDILTGIIEYFCEFPTAIHGVAQWQD